VRQIVDSNTFREVLSRMDDKMLAVVVTLAFSLVGVIGDYFLKLASQDDDSLRTRWFYLGFALYASTAFGWVFVMKHLKLATISVLYSVSMVLLLTTVGVAIFRETLNAYEIAGLLMAVASLVLLARFA
jgi:small multidrug resistance pump